jgi:D-alanine--poly(phosphoribitol) ligase subunit 1
MHFVDRIERWGQSCPGRPAHVSGGRTLTYGELCRRSDALAAELTRLLPPDRSPVVVLGHKEPEMLIGFLGAIKAGHPYAPVDTVVPPQRVERIVTTAGAKITLTPEKVAAMSQAPAPAAKLRIAAADPFYIMFTSGSTGEPKGVVITLGCLTSFVDWMLGEQPFEEGEVFLNIVPYSFDVSLMDTALGLVTGGTVFSITKEDVANPKQLYQKLSASAVTTWVSTPSFAQMCLVERSFTKEMLARVRRFLFCGETLAPEVAAQLLERFPEAEVWNTYGPTEATVATTSIKIDRDIVSLYSPLPIGYAMPGTKMPVVDENLRPVPDGERGQLIIAGPNVSPGYLGRQDLTDKAFFTLDGLRAYRTGDWARVKDGMLFFEGRMDNQIKLHGYRIELADVEANLRAVPGVRDAVVIAVMKDGQAEGLVAFVILNERPAGLSDFKASNNLRSQLAQRLPAYMLPRKFHFLDAFPMNTNGKADRKKLAESLA